MKITDIDFSYKINQNLVNMSKFAYELADVP